MILENPDGTYQFFALVKNEGQSYETVDNRKDSTRKTGRTKDTTAFVRSATCRGTTSQL